jgi:two-component system sensor histidine kinase YesM
MISIRVSKLISESESYVCITILDNGPGFSPDVLGTKEVSGTVDVLGMKDVIGTKDVKNEEASKEHIGIENIKKRMELLYHGRGTIFLSNSNGACVEFYIPIDINEVGA